MSAALATVRETLLRRPSLINGRAVAVRLLAAQEKCPPEKARELIETLKHSEVFVKIFKAAMPEEFKRETGSRAGIDQRFYAALGFPVEDVLWASRNGDPLRDGIRIESLSGHICNECGHFPDLPLHYQLAIYLLRDDLNLVALEEEPDAWREHRDWCWDVIAKAHRLPDRLRPSDEVEFESYSAFTKQKSQLRFLPLVAEAIAYSTGCIFFDFDPEYGFEDDLEWTPANVAWLRKEFKRAKEIACDIEAFAVWLYAKPRTRIMKALRLYKTAEQKANAKKRRRVPDANGKPLVRIL